MEIYFANLHILPEFQGRWLGTCIFRDLMAEGDARGVPIRLHVMKNNRARKLYERLGFSVWRETDLRFEMIRHCPAVGAASRPAEGPGQDQPRPRPDPFQPRAGLRVSVGPGGSPSNCGWMPVRSHSV